MSMPGNYNHVPPGHRGPVFEIDFPDDTIWARRNVFDDWTSRRQDAAFARAADQMASRMHGGARSAADEARRALDASRHWTDTEASNRWHREAVASHLRAAELERSANNFRNAAQAARDRHQAADNQRRNNDAESNGKHRSPDKQFGSFSDWVNWSIYGGWPPLFKKGQDAGRDTGPGKGPGPEGYIPRKSDDDSNPRQPSGPRDDPEPTREPNWQFEAFKMRIKDEHRGRTGNEMSDDEFEKWLKHNGVAEEGFDLIGLASTGAIRGGEAVAKKVGLMAAAYLSGEALENFRQELNGIMEQYKDMIRGQMAKGHLGQ